MPEDILPDIPSDLSPTETDPSVIERSFADQYQARKQQDKNRRKRDQKKRKRDIKKEELRQQ